MKGFTIETQEIGNFTEKVREQVGKDTYRQYPVY